jgi:N,N'-diacetyllegionaminate synthase
MMEMIIRGVSINVASPCYVICEIGNNHDGDIGKAKLLIEAAAECGADAVKFQTFKALDIVSPGVTADAYEGWAVDTDYKYWYQFIETLELPFEAYPSLIDLSHSLGLAFISTPGSIEALEFLDTQNVDAIKIASMDLNNAGLLSAARTIEKPIILSTGMAELEEVRLAVGELSDTSLALLHCVSNYPLKLEDANLRNILLLRDNFDCPIGFSNHALGDELDVLAIAGGASILEKHFTLSRDTERIAEHHFSMEPREMGVLIDRLRATERLLGSYQRILGQEEALNRVSFRRSVTAANQIRHGEIIKIENLKFVRPGNGIPPRDVESILGKRLKRTVEEGDKILHDDIA